MSTTVQASSPTSGESHRRQSRWSDYDPPKVPAPKYRHAAPSAPWPWMDFGVDSTTVHPVSPELSDESEWGKYPQSLFENWTDDQVERSQMLIKCRDYESSALHKVGMFDDGSFDKQIEARIVRKDSGADLTAYWNYLRIPPLSNIRLQALFIENMTLPILQMLGTRYNVEPFFFASSANWIPSRYQEDPKALEDHITIVLPFIHVFKGPRPLTRTKLIRTPTFRSVVEEPLPYTRENQTIDTQVPLSLPGNKFLFQDLLSLHMVRNTRTSMIISCHPSEETQGTSANRLRCLVQRTGDSVYWSKIFRRSKDPTFLFLAILWYALYAWDEAFEVLFHYINALEHDVLQFYNTKLTRELHKLQAYLLYYQQLLREFLRSVEFVRDTHNPAMNAPSISEAEREDSAKLLRTEAHNLIAEIKRLTRQREMMSARLDNVIRLVLATVNIEESKTRQELVEATMRDSSAMKQIAYLSMAILPATYLANVFSMNVREINTGTRGTLIQYIVSAVGLTLLTSWLVIVFQKQSFFYPGDSDVLHRTLWPLFYACGAASITIKRWTAPADRRSPLGMATSDEARS